MKITYYGHSTFLMETAGKQLLFDPFISPNEKAADINVNTIPADYVMISHGHEDHVADVESIAKRTGATIVSNFEIVTWFASKGLENGHPMNHGGSWDFDFGSVKSVTAVHSSMLPDRSYGGSAGGFVIDSEDKSVYYAGDTALTYDMKLIGEYHSLDLAFLPIGNNFTMGVGDAIQAAKFVGCNHVIGMHYDTFGYIVIDHQEAIEKFAEAGIKLTLIEIGSSIEI